LVFDEFATLNYWRQEMYKLRLIGAYENGIGFGNISIRKKNTNQFYISGSATGNFHELDNRHYALVTDVFIEKNLLFCSGANIASSESMSHAVIYQTCPNINGVIHVHSLSLWKRLLYQVPTTAADIPYGTPKMALAIVEVLKNHSAKIFAMAGHEEGIFVFGEDLKDAAKELMSYLR
jgi:L-ribulose-5-phosphate 4-epimerase